MSPPIMIKPKPAVGTRNHMPPIDAVMPAEEKLTANRGDDYMMEAFGLTDDNKHWLRMKAHGLYICQQELPPRDMSKTDRKKLSLNEDGVRRLLYNSATDVTKGYLWDYALVPWRAAFDYDIQYLQRRYPDCYARGVICGLFAKWNSGPDFKWLTRKYAKGRDLTQLYYQLSTERDADDGDTAEDLKPQVTQLSLHRQDTQVTSIPTQVSTVSKIVTVPSSIQHIPAPLRNPTEFAQKEGDVYWPHVILDIQYHDQTMPKLNRLAFSFICGLHSCAPSNIQMKIIKEKLQAQGVKADETFLQLKGFQDEFTWELSDMCVALTLWCRGRSHTEFDVPLMLASREPRLSNTRTTQEKTILPTESNVSTFTGHGNSDRNEGVLENNNGLPRVANNATPPVNLTRGRKRMRPNPNNLRPYRVTIELSSDDDLPSGTSPNTQPTNQMQQDVKEPER